MEPHPLFCELDQFFLEDGIPIEDHIWKESARWVKFEEDVEVGGGRWSKPYVGTLPLYSLFEVRNLFNNAAINFNLKVSNLEELADALGDSLVKTRQISPDQGEPVKNVILKKHWHLFDSRRTKLRNKPSKSSIKGNRDSFVKGKADDGDESDYNAYHSVSAADKHIQAQFYQMKLTLDAQVKPQFHSADWTKDGLEKNTLAVPAANDDEDSDREGHLSPDSSKKYDKDFLKKLDPSSETANVLVGELPFLTNQAVALVRLKEAVILPITEIPVPTRFVFLLLGPVGEAPKFHQIGRSVGTLMADEVFRNVGYNAKDNKDFLAGLDEFLSNCMVLPPSEWDPTIRIEPPKKVPSQEERKAVTGEHLIGQLIQNQSRPNDEPDKNDKGRKDDDKKGNSAESGHAGGKRPALIEQMVSVHEKTEDHAGPTLERTGRLFGGLINDIKRRAPHYGSDFKDAIHIQCFASFFFIYFACLTPIITFGGLLEQATGGYLGTIESILSGAVVGITYHLFAGQPLTVMGSTGPVLVFERIVYTMCKSLDWNYLSFRMCIGLWVMLFLLLFVAFDLSYLVKYITRFTEESFAFLIALIFIIEAFKKQMHILEEFPINRKWTPDYLQDRNCTCNANNTHYNITSKDFIYMLKHYNPPMIYSIDNKTNISTPIDVDYDEITRRFFTWDWLNIYYMCQDLQGVWEGSGCSKNYFPDIFFFSCLLFIFTFVISFGLKQLRFSRFFPTMMRSIIADFAVPIAICSMSAADLLLGLGTPKLNVPVKFEPTLGYEQRGWIINPISKNPWWTVFVAIGPAIFATILIFMDQQITAVIVNRKENKLKKGAGYHLDLMVLAVLMGITSLLGTPWFVAATVLSINHVISLKKTSKTAAPGESAQFLGCREQRVTGVLTFLLIGLSVFLTPVLTHIPMSVLYGVFLFMGVSSLRGVQFFQRIILLIIPQKFQPDYIYLRHVPLIRIHLFTLIQIICLALLFTIKSIKLISIAFPLLVLAMCFVRKGLEYIFTLHELAWLDDIMPEAKKREKEDEEKGHLQIDLQDGKKIWIQPDDIAINKPADNDIDFSEEMVKTAIWKHLTEEERRRRASHDFVLRKPSVAAHTFEKRDGPDAKPLLTTSFNEKSKD